MTVIVAPALTTSTIYGYILDVLGNPIKGATATFKLVDIPTYIELPSETYIVPIEPVTVKTDEDGYFEVQLIQEIAVDVFIPSIKFRRTIQVPTVPSINFFSIE